MTRESGTRSGRHLADASLWYIPEAAIATGMVVIPTLQTTCRG